MAGDTLLRGGAGLGGALAGTALAPFTGGASMIPVLAASGAALGTGVTTAATGGDMKDAFINAGLAGAGGYFAGPTLGTMTGAGMTSAKELAGAVAPSAAGASGGGGLFSMDMLQKAGLGTMIGGQIASLVNPPPQPFMGSGPVSGPQFNPSAVNTQQFMVPIPQAGPPRFSL